MISSSIVIIALLLVSTERMQRSQPLIVVSTEMLHLVVLLNIVAWQVKILHNVAIVALVNVCWFLVSRTLWCFKDVLCRHMRRLKEVFRPIWVANMAFGPTWSLQNFVNFVWLSKIWPANGLRFGKCSSAIFKETLCTIVEVQMLVMIVIWVIKVLSRANWCLLGFVELRKQVTEEAVKVWVLLDRFNVFTLPVDNLLQSLLRSFMFRLRVRNLDIEREMSLVDQTIKVSTMICNGMNILNELMLNTVIGMLGIIMLLHDTIDLLVSHMPDMINILCPGLV